MAQSRLEKVGTIYTRVCSLIKAGALKEENRPMWLDVYKAFPPKYEPCFDRPGSQEPVRQIFYVEDQIRAKFHNEYKHFSMVNLLDNNAVSKTEQFLIIYKHLEKEGIPKAEIYDKAIEEFLTKFKTEKPRKEVAEAETAAEAEPIKSPRRGIKVERFFEENEAVSAKESSDQDVEDEKKYKPIRLSIEKIFEDNDEKKSK